MELQAGLFTFSLIALAELGDKSQLVCMTLAARRSAKAVFSGAVAAFAMLNGLAVLVGGSISHLIAPEWAVLAAAVLFAVFGLQALLESAVAQDCGEIKVGKRVFFSAFSVIALAELGDKTQLSVAALSTQYSAVVVWAASTLALSTTTGVAVWLGRSVLRQMNVQLVHRLSGVLFLLMGVALAWHAYALLTSV
ncbi:TMEM165/GDT1 family protein [Echinimonas agarilytica]|uniref:GDT1 family protein n=1 Tax=Echinimonas agarilytica TaxID=1215918 RepID=A0AA41W4B7_9GAMM|nr:TMEM165/GDT1 family protein [Echinimonas agarilytica]MCM2678359.1 TMEM165/GDT1 family protein [Echinimonas agarilytica]